jgi:hypothetical protein
VLNRRAEAYRQMLERQGLWSSLRPSARDLVSDIPSHVPRISIV